MRPREWRPQLKRDPLGTHNNMAQDDLTPTQAEFRRVGISAQTFAEIVRENEGFRSPRTSWAMSIGPEVWAILKSLPDGAGPEGFIRAFRARFGKP